MTKSNDLLTPHYNLKVSGQKIKIAGGYTLEVTTQYAVAKLLKEPRTVVFDKVLTVQ
jgi:hypothetical protein